MEPKGNWIKLSTFLKYGLIEEKKSSIVDIQFSSKYASVSILYIKHFLNVYRKLIKLFKVLAKEK